MSLNSTMVRFISNGSADFEMLAEALNSTMVRFICFGMYVTDETIEAFKFHYGKIHMNLPHRWQVQQ